MEAIKRKQIIDLFKHPRVTMEYGLWFSGCVGEGEYMMWYDNGQLAIHSFYKHGRLHGELTSWYMDGRLDAYRWYKDGVRNR
jgi:antitoxin component YwqK of YwqJK toxin-antitoxin module